MALQKSFLLHSYPYRDTSSLVKLFTEQQGLITVIARGVKKQGSMWRGFLQAFTLLTVDYVGKGDVKTLSALEAMQRITLTDNCLVSGLYLNEILLNILPSYEPYPEIFHLYQTALHALSNVSNPEPVLRNFELGLLEALGYLPNFLIDSTGEIVVADQYYLVVPEHMPQRIATAERGARIFQGAELALVAARDWTNPAALKITKRLLRDWISYYCHGKPLKSRELLINK